MILLSFIELILYKIQGILISIKTVRAIILLPMPLNPSLRIQLTHPGEAGATDVQAGTPALNW